MQEVKKIAKSTIIYLFGSVGTKLITFFLLPILTSNIPEGDFGVYNTNCSYATLISSVLFLDIWSGIMRYMFDYKKKKEQYQVIYSGLLIFFCSLVLYIVVFTVYDHFSPMEYMGWVLAYGASICLQSLYSYIARALGFSGLFAVSGIVSALANAGITFVMVYLLKWDYSALYIAYIAGIIAQCVMLECKVHLLTNFRSAGISRSLVRQIFRFSLPLCLNSACYWLLTGFNTIFVMAKLGDMQTGYYSMAGKFAVMLNLVTSCFSMAWQELAFNKSDSSKETGHFYSKAANLYCKALFCGYLLLMPFISLIFPFFIKGGYGPVKEIIPLYMLATVVSVLSTFLGNILTAYKKNDTIFISTLAACIVNVSIAYFTVNYIGVQAASLAMLCGYLACDIARVIFIKRSISFHFNCKPFFYMIPGCILITIIYLYFDWYIQIPALLIGIGISCLLFRNLIKTTYQKLKGRLAARKAAN